MSTNPALYGSSASGVVRAPTAPRAYRGQMCGIHVSGLPFVDGGSADPTLVLSWFYGRYGVSDRARIRAQWKAQGALDVLVSWPDDRGFGLSVGQHIDLCRELCADGLRPANMLSSKVYDPHDDAAGTLANIRPALTALVAADVVSRYCTGFEMDLWNSYASLQGITDGIAAIVVPKRPLYVHFSPGYADWRPDHPGSTFAEYWNAQVGKLTGLFHQRNQGWDNDMWRARVVDVLERFAGHFGVTPDSGFGHPFDFIELEISADDQFYGRITEAQGNALGAYIVATPPVVGPAGSVSVMGSGNGQ
jgi:hypothetical protein